MERLAPGLFAALVAPVSAVQGVAALEPPPESLGQALQDAVHVDEQCLPAALRQNLRVEHRQGQGRLLKGAVRVPVVARPRDAQLLAVDRDVGGDEDLRVLGMVVIVLEVDLGGAELPGEVDVLGVRQRLTTKQDEPPPVEHSLAERAQLLRAELSDIDSLDERSRALDESLLYLHRRGSSCEGIPRPGGLAGFLSRPGVQATRMLPSRGVLSWRTMDLHAKSNRLSRDGVCQGSCRVLSGSPTFGLPFQQERPPRWDDMLEERGVNGNLYVPRGGGGGRPDLHLDRLRGTPTPRILGPPDGHATPRLFIDRSPPREHRAITSEVPVIGRDETQAPVEMIAVVPGAEPGHPGTRDLQ